LSIASAAASLREKLAAFSDRLDRIAQWTCVACVLAMLSISFAGFFYMIATGSALSWTYSLARLFIPWIGMLSITVAFHAGEHVAMSMLPRVLPAALARLLRWLSLACVALFGGLLVWFGWDFFVTTSQYYMVSDQIQIHARWVTACVPVTGLILLVHLAHGFAVLEPLHPEGATDAAIPG
jgi:TRAP-type C4-dicarboxylate transport system permease small subunit